MKTKGTNVMQYVRLAVIGILGSITFLLMICEPIDEETWVQTFYITKGLAALIGFGLYLLCKRWYAKGLLPEIDED